MLPSGIVERLGEQYCIHLIRALSHDSGCHVLDENDAVIGLVRILTSQN